MGAGFLWRVEVSLTCLGVHWLAPGVTGTADVTVSLARLGLRWLASVSQVCLGFT